VCACMYWAAAMTGSGGHGRRLGSAALDEMQLSTRFCIVNRAHGRAHVWPCRASSCLQCPQLVLWSWEHDTATSSTITDSKKVLYPAYSAKGDLEQPFECYALARLFAAVAVCGRTPLWLDCEHVTSREPPCVLPLGAPCGALLPHVGIPLCEHFLALFLCALHIS